MATQTVELYASPLEGSSVVIVYDDVQMTASALQAMCPQSAKSNLRINATVSGKPLASDTSPGAAQGNILLSPPLTVKVVSVDWKNPPTSGLLFVGLDAVSIGHPAPAAVAIAPAA